MLRLKYSDLEQVNIDSNRVYPLVAAAIANGVFNLIRFNPPHRREEPLKCIRQSERSAELALRPSSGAVRSGLGPSR